MFLRVQPNSRKISYDFIRRRFGRGSVTVLNDSRRYSLGKSAAAAVVSVEISPIGAHTSRKFERAQVRAVNADINGTVLGPVSLYNIWG